MSVNPDVRLDQMGTLEVLVKRANNLVAKTATATPIRLPSSLSTARSAFALASSISHP